MKDTDSSGIAGVMEEGIARAENSADQALPTTWVRTDSARSSAVTCSPIWIMRGEKIEDISILGGQGEKIGLSCGCCSG